MNDLPPSPVLPVPSSRQLAWHKLERYAFFHFGPNTFTDKEWGEGIEDPRVFNPTHLDTRQWVRTMKAAGMKGVIITAKHHDGFCLWPSKYSTHTVAQSTWKDGKGDVLRELSASCKAEGMKLGVYLSPWDRNHPSYGTPEYNQVFAHMLREVLSNYGPIFEVWFDGANGEGPNGKKQVYDWKLFIDTVRELQPNAVIFSDAGPDIRWVGNEAGYAGETNWAPLKRDLFYPGTPLYAQLTSGHEDGTHWVPAECDVSIRPGWFYHPGEDSKVKTVAQLMDIYYGSVGRGGSFLLNVPPNREGRISDVDVQRLLDFKMALDKEFSFKLKPVKVEADAVRGHGFEPARVADGKLNTYWAAPDGQATGEVTLDFGKQVTLDRVLLQEPIALGQRVKRFGILAETLNEWKQVAYGTTIGVKRLIQIPALTTRRLKLVILDSKACPALCEFAAFDSKGKDR